MPVLIFDSNACLVLKFHVGNIDVMQGCWYLRSTDYADPENARLFPSPWLGSKVRLFQIK